MVDLEKMTKSKTVNNFNICLDLAQYYPDDNGTSIGGTYTLPQGSQPAVFRPTSVGSLPQTPGHGNMVIQGPNATSPQPGRLEPQQSPSTNAIFYPDLPGSSLGQLNILCEFY